MNGYNKNGKKTPRETLPNLTYFKIIFIGMHSRQQQKCVIEHMPFVAFIAVRKIWEVSKNAPFTNNTLFLQSQNLKIYFGFYFFHSPFCL